MTPQEILKLSYKEQTKPNNLKVLVDVYRNECEKEVCVSCPGSLAEMMRYLNKYYDMSDFELKGNAYYRISKESSKTINNNIMTNDLASEFIRENPERIKLFAKYPDNWEEIVFPKIPLLPREELMEMKLHELKDRYPEITHDFGTTKEVYVDKIISDYEEE